MSFLTTKADQPQMNVLLCVLVNAIYRIVRKLRYVAGFVSHRNVFIDVELMQS